MHPSKILLKINTFCAIISEVLVVFLMFMVVAEIAGRHFLNTPIPGHVESATLSLVMIVYLGIAYTQWDNSHIRVDLFISRLTGPVKDLTLCTILILCCIPSALITWATGMKALDSIIEKEFLAGIINFPVWPGRCAVTLGFALLSLTLLTQAASHAVAFLNRNLKDRQNE